MERCIICQGGVEEATRRCLHCGHVQPVPQVNIPVRAVGELSIRCPQCDHIIPANAHFCSSCGYRLTGPAMQVTLKSPQTLPTTPQPPDFRRNSSLAEMQKMQTPQAQTATEPQKSLPGEKAASKAGEQQGVGKEEEKERGPIDIFRERRLVLKNVSLPLKVIVYVIIGQMLVVALLLLTQNVPQPQVSSGVVDFAGGTFVVPLVIFLVMNISLAVGYWFVLAGALQVRWLVGLPIVVAVTGILAYVPFSWIKEGVGVWENWAQLGVLALLGVWALWITAQRWRTRQKTAGSQAAAPPWRGWSFTGVLALLLAYYALEFLVWGTYVHIGQAMAGTGFLLEDLGLQASVLPTLVVVIFLLGSTDLLEWGEMIAGSITSAAKRVGPPSLLWILTPLAAIAMVVNVLRLDGGGVLLSLVVVAVLAGLVVFLIHLVPIRERWSDEIRSQAVLLGAVLIYIYLTLLSNITDAIGGSRGLLFQFFVPFYALLITPIGLAVLTTGLFLLLSGRVDNPKQRAIWLFLVMVVLSLFIAGVPAFLSAARLPAIFPLQHLQDGLQLFVGLGVLVWVISLRARKQMAEATEPLANTFLLLAGLQTVAWVQDLLNGISTLGARSALLLALLFLLTGFWSLITAGEQLQLTDTPANTPLYPREGRILLYAGSTLVANAMLLYLGSLRVATTGASAPDSLIGDAFSPLGLSVLGSLLVVLAFILRMGSRPVASPAVATPTSQSARRVPSRAIQFGILGSGALVTVLVFVFVLVSALPRLVQTNTQLISQPYKALVPGPDCDTGGASWSVTPGAAISTHCLSTGLQALAKPKGIGDIGFLPPNGVFSQNYRVSVHVNLSHLSNGCVSINTRFTSAGDYRNNICSDHSWAITRISLANVTSLAVGFVGQATGYTIETTSDGANQRIAINGVEVGSVSDSTFTSGSIELGLQNNTAEPASALFSDFEFTSLPASLSFSRLATYRASRPGPSCDQGGGQWALMDPIRVQCRLEGVQFEAPAHSSEQIGFTPPGGAALPNNYQVSVQVDSSSMRDGCVALGLRASAGKDYVYALCSNNFWDIALENNGTLSILASGKVASAQVYILEGAVDGSKLSFAINGVQVGFATNSVLTVNAFTGFGFLINGKNTGTVVLGNFVFTPLP